MGGCSLDTMIRTNGLRVDWGTRKARSGCSCALNSDHPCSLNFDQASRPAHRARREIVSLRVLPIGRVLHGGLGEVQAGDYASRVVVPTRSGLPPAQTVSNDRYVREISQH